MDKENPFNKKPKKDKDNDKIIQLLRRTSYMEAERAPIDFIFDKLTDYVQPNRATYTRMSNPIKDPTVRLEDRVDSTAVQARALFSAKVISEMIGSATRWFSLRHNNPRIDMQDHVRRYLNDVSEKIYGITNKTTNRLALSEAVNDWCTYGYGVIRNTIRSGLLIFAAVAPQDTYFSVNVHGEVDTVYHKYRYTVRQAAQMWGRDKLPEKWVKLLDEKPDEFIVLGHFTCPNEHKKEHKIMSEDMDYKSIWFSPDEKHIIHEGFLETKPYTVFRFWVRSGETYPTAPGIECLPEIEQCQQLVRDLNSIAQKEAEPPLAAPDDAHIMDINQYASGLSYVPFDNSGNPMIKPLLPRVGDVRYIQDRLQACQSVIRSTFFVEPLMNKDTSIRTAAEVYSRKNEEMLGQVPPMNRFEDEMADEIIGICQDYLMKYDADVQLIPEELIGSTPKVEYSAPLAKTQRAQDVQNIQQLILGLGQMGQMLPAMGQYLQYKVSPEGIVAVLADALSIDNRVLVPEEQVRAILDAQQQQQQEQAMMQMGMELSNQAQGMAKAGLLKREDITGVPEAEDGQ